LKTIFYFVVPAAFVAGFFAGAYRGTGKGPPVSAPSSATSFTCSMHPQVVRDAPGACPICGMELIPRPTATSSDGTAPRLVISEAAGIRAGIRAMPPLFRAPQAALRRLAGRIVVAATESQPAQAELFAAPDDAKAMAVGQGATVSSEVEPRAVFSGEVAAVAPGGAKGMSIVRLKVTDSARRLPKNSHVDAEVTTASKEAPQLLIPRTAPLFTGRRSIVYVMLGHTAQPIYEARVVELGPLTADGYYPVLSGLSAEQMVVMHGAFMLDADLELRGDVSMLDSPSDVDLVELARPRTAAERAAIDTNLDRWARRTGYRNTVVAVPGEFVRPLRNVIEAYLEAARSLSQDDLARAKAGGGRVRVASEAIRPDSATSFAAAWAPIAVALEPRALELEESADLETARFAISGLSRTMVRALRGFGNMTGETLQWVHCPEALAGRGADWIQIDGGTQNPYLGKERLSCGEVRDHVLPHAYLPAPKELFEGAAAR
jgi:Cu(I)/Ag(I) efflux system membrane fusion protein